MSGVESKFKLLKERYLGSSCGALNIFYKQMAPWTSFPDKTQNWISETDTVFSMTGSPAWQRHVVYLVLIKNSSW